MGFIKLRGHHISDLWWYVRYREGGLSHEEILEEYLKFDKSVGDYGRGERFEEYTNKIFQLIYEGKTNHILFVGGLDNICLGPNNKDTGSWCRVYNPINCLGERLLKEDEWHLHSKGFEKGVPVDGTQLLDKIKKMTLYDMIPKI